jgi:hypothetical protein
MTSYRTQKTSEEVLENLLKSQTEEEEKYTYFLLTAAGAAIAFSISQTKESGISPHHILLAIAGLFWAISFFSGCSLIHCGIRKLRLNASLCIENINKVLTQDFHNALGKKYAQISKHADIFWRLQFWCLIAGATCFIAWHIWGMYLRSEEVKTFKQVACTIPKQIQQDKKR